MNENTVYDMSSPIKVRGFVQPFGQAPADFNARTIIHVSNTKAFMKVNWNPANENAFDSITTSGLIINIDDASRFHHVGRGRIVTDLKDYDSAPVIQPPSSDEEGVFIIESKEGTQIHKTFADFINDLNNTVLNENSAVKKIFATGSFDDASVTLSANYIQVRRD